MDDTTYTENGGVPIVQGDETAWNFGIVEGIQVSDPLPELAQAAPNISGAWDGKSNVNHMAVVRKVLGEDLAPQQQPRGTCGGRAGSGTLDVVQCLQIATGQRLEFKRTSHAWLYSMARFVNGMRGTSDGVPGGSIPPIIAEYGSLNREEAGDTKYAGAGSDELAVRWGSGGPPKEYYPIAKDNVARGVARVKTCEELADAMASGAVGCYSGSQGFTMERDSEGFCRPSGTWHHYIYFAGVVVTAKGRKGFAYGQSWGANTPRGPLLEGYPSNFFGVDWDVMGQMLRGGAMHMVTGFEGWKKDGPDLPPWIF